MPKRECSHHNCSTLVDKGSRCDTHAVELKRTRYREYDNDRRSIKGSTFYNSSEWKSVKRSALIRDRYLCSHCLSPDHMNGMTRLTPADVVHHIVYLGDGEGWDLRLTLSNLVSLCHTCHNQIHRFDKKKR